MQIYSYLWSVNKGHNNNYMIRAQQTAFSRKITA